MIVIILLYLVVGFVMLCSMFVLCSESCSSVFCILVFMGFIWFVIFVCRSFFLYFLFLSVSFAWNGCVYAFILNWMIWNVLWWFEVVMSYVVMFEFSWKLLVLLEFECGLNCSNFFVDYWSIMGVDVDWGYILDDLFINVYDSGFLFGNDFSSSFLDPIVLYWGVVDRILDDSFSSFWDMYLDVWCSNHVFCELEGLVVDSISDFLLCSLWSLCFYLCVLLVIGVFFILYLSGIIWVFFYFLSISINVSDIFMW